MRILIVSTNERTGGAAVASKRLMEALNSNGVKAKMLVSNKETTSVTVVGLNRKIAMRLKFIWERWCIFTHLHFSRRHLFEIDIANAGANITSLREFKEADVIHLAWINQGMLSLGDIKKIIASGKPIVWTMHDMWCATAICHYSRACTLYNNMCAPCCLLPNGGSEHDLSRKIWKRKLRLYKDSNIAFVACSRWLEGQAKTSALLNGQYVTNIPNPIDTRVYCKKDKGKARLQAGLPADKRLILFVAQRVTDERKGMAYFIEAINTLVAAYPDMKTNTGIAILGGSADEMAEELPLSVYPLGYVTDEKAIVNIYNSADTYVLPSLEDNLPNTIMEAMACGVPCVGFDVGGIPEEIDHLKNGYVAQFESSDDLAKGINWVINEADYDLLSKQAVSKVASAYSQQSVAARYTDVYNKVLAQKGRGGI